MVARRSSEFQLIKYFQLSFVCRETIDESGDTPITICTVQLPGEAQVEGRGTNNKKAKADACRKAMKAHENYAHTDKGSKDPIND